MSDSLIDRLMTVMSHYELSPNAFAKESSIDPSHLNKMMKGELTITKKTLEKIGQAFPQVNMEWIKSGEGDMLGISKENNKMPVVKNTEDYHLVPLINIDSVGGMDSPNVLAVGDQFIERFIPFTGALEGDRAIYQSGDSMTPTIPAGSVLQIRRVDDWREYFGYGGIFVLWLKDNRRITKQVMKFGPDPQNYVTCHSFNPDAADEELPKKFIREVWKVIKVLTDKGW